MGRLIDEDAVIKAIDKHTRDDGVLDDDISVILEGIPTDFNKEKVKADLQVKEDYASRKRAEADLYDISVYWVGNENGFKEAIEIVEKGGME